MCLFKHFVNFGSHHHHYHKGLSKCAQTHIHFKWSESVAVAVVSRAFPICLPPSYGKHRRRYTLLMLLLLNGEMQMKFWNRGTPPKTTRKWYNLKFANDSGLRLCTRAVVCFVTLFSFRQFIFCLTDRIRSCILCMPVSYYPTSRCNSCRLCVCCSY